MKSQPQNPEFRINPDHFYPCTLNFRPGVYSFPQTAYKFVTVKHFNLAAANFVCIYVWTFRLIFIFKLLDFQLQFYTLICKSNRPPGYKTFSMLKTAEHRIHPAHKCKMPTIIKFILLINLKCGLSQFCELILTSGRQGAAKTSAGQEEGPPVGGREEGPLPTIVGILTFISMINTTSERLKARNFFIPRYFSF